MPASWLNFFLITSASGGVSAGPLRRLTPVNPPPPAPPSSIQECMAARCPGSALPMTPFSQSSSELQRVSVASVSPLSLSATTSASGFFEESILHREWLIHWSPIPSPRHGSTRVLLGVPSILFAGVHIHARVRVRVVRRLSSRGSSFPRQAQGKRVEWYGVPLRQVCY